MNCTCKRCSRSKNGGTLILLDDTCFQVHPQTKIMGISQVANLINLFEGIRSLGYSIVDYGYLNAIRSTFPFNNQDPTLRQYFGTIISYLTKQRNKLNFYGRFGVSTYKDTIDLLISKYRGREIIIATTKNLTGYQEIKGKSVYYWNLFDEKSIIFKRVYKHSNKHIEWKSDPNITYCPIDEKELDCCLTRAISLEQLNSFENIEQQLYAYHEGYHLIIRNHKTLDQLVTHTIKKFGGEQLNINVMTIEYHGYQINSFSYDDALKLFKSADISVDDSIIKSSDKFYNRELDMYLATNTNETIIKRICKYRSLMKSS